MNRSGPASSRGLNVYGLATLEEGNSLSKTPSRYVQLTPCGDLSECRARFGFDRAIFASRDRRRLRLLFARFAEESALIWCLLSLLFALPTALPRNFNSVLPPSPHSPLPAFAATLLLPL